MVFDYNQLDRGYFGTAVFGKKGELNIEFYHEKFLAKD